MTNKLNLGCGEDYKQGFLNLDSNERVTADIYADLEKPLLLEDNKFSYILADNTLEHIQNLIQLMEELWRISKNKAIIEIHVPHYTGIFGRKFIDHKQEFGIGSFDCFSDNDASSQNYTTARFKVTSEKLHVFKRNSRGTRYPKFSIFVNKVIRQLK